MPLDLGAAGRRGARGLRIPGLIDGNLRVIRVGDSAGTSTVVRWNSADKAAAAVLSNSNRTLTSSGASNGAARSDLSWTTGKKYFELVLDATGAANNESSFGLATSGTSLTINNSGGSYVQCSQDTGSGGVAVFQIPEFLGTIAGAAPWYDATIGGTDISAPTTTTLMIAGDFSGGKVWFGKNGGWLGDPARGLYPAATWTGGSLTLFLWALCYDSTNQFSIPATTAYPAPGGFSVA